MDKGLHKYLLVDNGREGKLSKKLTIVGSIHLEISINTFEFQILTQSSLAVPINFKYPNPDLPALHNQLIQVSHLKLKSNSNLPLLTTTKKSKIKLIESQDTTSVQAVKAEENLKRTKNLDSDLQLWKVLIMPLTNYALLTSSGVKFELKSLLNISEKVSFTGILISVEPANSHSGLTSIFKLRDTLTNDSIPIFVSYSNTEHMQNYLNSLAMFDTLMVNASRMVSKRLSIYCRLVLQQDFSNFKRIKAHSSACVELECACKFLTGRFTAYFVNSFNKLILIIINYNSLNTKYSNALYGNILRYDKSNLCLFCTLLTNL